jgi:hypothetical protein
MKVKDLIALLENCDPEANVVLTTGSSYPMEHDISGLVTRPECRATAWDRGEPYAEQAGTGSDIVLLEGPWLRYGNRVAWHATRCGPRRQERK